MDATDLKKIETYLRQKLGNDQLIVKSRGNIADSAELYLGDEFLAVIYEDREDPQDISYNLEMAILGFDLNETYA